MRHKIQNANIQISWSLSLSAHRDMITVGATSKNEKKKMKKKLKCGGITQGREKRTDKRLELMQSNLGH